MIRSLLICNADGIPFFTRDFSNSQVVDPTLLSGLISAIGSLGKTLFKQEIATISFGMPPEITSSIIIVTKELITEDKKIYFVFFTQGVDGDHKVMREISTTIFIELKRFLKNQYPDNNLIRIEVDKVIDQKFKNLTNIVKK